MDRPHLALTTVVLGVALVSGAWYGLRQPEPPPVAVATRPAATTPAPVHLLTVHVSGAVTRPGLVQVPAGARVADALAAAGGALPGAALHAVNLAATVGDGQRVEVPRRGAATAGGEQSGDGKVAINTASAEQLERLPGVGPVTAAAIVAHRAEHGPFAVVEDLLDVPGIGEGKLAALRDAVIVP